jgi:hypothetical protein
MTLQEYQEMIRKKFTSMTVIRDIDCFIPHNHQKRKYTVPKNVQLRGVQTDTYNETLAVTDGSPMKKLKQFAILKNKSQD